MSQFKIGDQITFNYPASHRLRTVAHDPVPTVLVLHDGYRDAAKGGQILVHGLNINLLTQKEIEYLKAVLNPDFAQEIQKKDPAWAARLRTMESRYDSLNITHPKDFYVRFIRNFIRPRGYDPYRTYVPAKMSGVKVLVKREILVGDQKDSVFNKFMNRVKYHRGKRLI